MSTQPPTPQTTVEEVTRDQPGAGRVFMKYRTDCVGCRLARFCTLEDVAGTYGISLQALRADLQVSARPADMRQQHSSASAGPELRPGQT